MKPIGRSHPFGSAWNKFCVPSQLNLAGKLNVECNKPNDLGRFLWGLKTKILSRKFLQDSSLWSD